MNHLAVSNLPIRRGRWIDHKGMTAEALLSHAIDAAPIEKELAGRNLDNRGTGSTRLLQESAATGIRGTFTSEAVPSGQGAAENAPARVGSRIVNPRKIVDVPPVRPEQARRAGVKGVVLLELTIGANGRVTKSQVIRSIPMLDAAAVEATQQWRYEPTLLNGGPVPIILIAAVKFP